jgi:GTP-binding protein EngB required for normal cell division
MTNIVGRVREALSGERRVDAEALVRRFEALHEFLRTVDGLLPAERLVTAHTLVERAGTRLALSREHTVVALAGATGGGKSSLFNALARFDMSPVGVRRPTTGVTHACVWGAPEGATQLLDWIGVLPRHRYVRESPLDGEDEADLRGLVLLDLPDFDSVERSHRREVDRLLGLVDLVVWVVDPQKYADRLVHTAYLHEFHRHKEVTVVVLNQADRLAPGDVPRVLADLRRLLDEDQLGGVPVLAATALHSAGVADLRRTLEQAVAERQAALRRLAADLTATVDQLAEHMGPAVRADIDRDTTGRLADALAASAGVPAVAEATEHAYRHRAAGTTGWPVVRGLRRLRPDPLRRLHLPGPAKRDAADAAAESLVAATSVPDPTAAQRAAAGLAVRAVAERAGTDLPPPWRSAVAAAARSRLADLPDALDRAIASTDLGLHRRPFWWRLVGAVQWLLTLAAVVGVGWLVAGYVLRALGLPPPDYPMIGVVPLPTVLLVGGLLAGLLVAAVVRPVIRWAARRARRRAESRLRAAVDQVGRALVVAPVQEVLDSYSRGREALAAAAR